MNAIKTYTLFDRMKLNQLALQKTSSFILYTLLIIMKNKLKLLSQSNKINGKLSVNARRYFFRKY